MSFPSCVRLRETLDRRPGLLIALITIQVAWATSFIGPPVAHEAAMSDPAPQPIAEAA